MHIMAQIIPLEIVTFSKTIDIVGYNVDTKNSTVDREIVKKPIAQKLPRKQHHLSFNYINRQHLI